MIFQMIAAQIRLQVPEAHAAAIGLHVKEAKFTGKAHLPGGAYRQLNEAKADPALVELFVDAAQQHGLTDVHLVSFEFMFSEKRCEVTAFGKQNGQKAHFTESHPIQ